MDTSPLYQWQHISIEREQADWRHYGHSVAIKAEEIVGPDWKETAQALLRGIAGAGLLIERCAYKKSKRK